MIEKHNEWHTGKRYFQLQKKSDEYPEHTTKSCKHLRIGNPIEKTGQKIWIGN